MRWYARNETGMEFDFKTEEPLNEAETQKLKLWQLLAALTNSRSTIRIETGSGVVESSVRELESFAEAQRLKFGFAEDLLDFEDALRQKSRDLLRAFHPDPDDLALKIAADAVIGAGIFHYVLKSRGSLSGLFLDWILLYA